MLPRATERRGRPLGEADVARGGRRTASGNLRDRLPSRYCVPRTGDIVLVEATVAVAVVVVVVVVVGQW